MANSDDKKRLYRGEMPVGRKYKTAAAKGKKIESFVEKRLVVEGSVAAQPNCW